LIDRNLFKKYLKIILKILRNYKIEVRDTKILIFKNLGYDIGTEMFQLFFHDIKLMSQFITTLYGQ